MDENGEIKEAVDQTEAAREYKTDAAWDDEEDCCSRRYLFCHRPEMRHIYTRMQTFGWWPIQLRQKPRELAKAGFFNTGDHDAVSDSGSEYKNLKVKALLKSLGITQLFALNETKASYAERVIKTIKMRLYCYMLKNFTYKYMDVLEKVVYSYNHTKHRMLGQTPASVNQTNKGEVRLSQYLIKPKKAIHKKKFTFNIGDKVRVSHLRGTFDREYQEKWSGEIFTIEKRYWSQGKDLYKLKDWGGDAIEGTFYAAELQKVTENPDQLYRIQDIVKRRTRNKQKEVLVKWLHWPKKYNSWIQEADVV
ncbi:uncharacterized protein LOC121368791 [Gigantopelta aegis]|uniref:uncharacterized protein LOC121368791 n=1 Tax=Gigantopelta aegis TaxID=1735272 RepID=UPI001B88926D|nr:uncharacterized protein LOC121368791 [Gigantopelta aegis]